MSNPQLTALQERLAMLKRIRSPWEGSFDEIQRLVRPNTISFRNLRGQPQGQKKHEDLLDGTAAWSLEQFAAGLGSFLTSPGERWFEVALEGYKAKDLPKELVIWLERVSDAIYYSYALPASGQASALHELYLDVGAFGTGVVLLEEGHKNAPLVFRGFPLGQNFMDEDENGTTDTNFRVWYPTKRNILQQFPDAINVERLEKAKDDDRFEVVHAVMPRNDRNPEDKSSKGKPFASFYFSPDLEAILSESGFDEFPYMVPRWSKLPGETYGRSPAMSVVPDIKMLNQMVREMIFSAQLSNRPPFVFDDDSMLLPVKTILPGSILYKNTGAEMPTPLLSGSQPMLTLEMINENRDAIRRAFYVDFLLRPKKKERQTTTEIMDDRSEMLRQMGPMLGRLQTELLGPMIRRSFFILSRKNLLPPAPPVAQEFLGTPLDIHYISPAAKAQFGSKAGSVMQYIQDVAQLGPLFGPEIAQSINIPELMAELARLRDVSRRVIKSPAEIKKAQKEMQEAQQTQQMMEAAPDGAKAMKDIAQARQADPTLLDSFG